MDTPKKVWFHFWVNQINILFIFSGYFTIASYVTSISIITQRTDGIWNRTLVAGAKPYHFILSHLLEGLIILVIQFMEYFGYTIFFLSSNITWNAMILLGLLLFGTGLSGLVFGLFMSTITSTVLTSFTMGQVFIYPTSFVSGSFRTFF